MKQTNKVGSIIVLAKTHDILISLLQVVQLKFLYGFPAGTETPNREVKSYTLYLFPIRPNSRILRYRCREINNNTGLN